MDEQEKIAALDETDCNTKNSPISFNVSWASLYSLMKRSEARGGG